MQYILQVGHTHKLVSVCTAIIIKVIIVDTLTAAKQCALWHNNQCINIAKGVAPKDITVD